MTIDSTGGSGPTALAACLRELVAQAPDRPAVTDDHVTLTRAGLDRRTNQLARRFASLGVTRGSMVSIALVNQVRHLECSIAAWKLGAIPQPLSHRLPPAELSALLEVADPALVVGLPPQDSHPWLRGDEDVTDESDAALPDVIGPAWKAPTSGGSTGRPKLIVAGQEATAEGVLAGCDHLRLERDGVMLTTAPLYHNAPNMFSLISVLQGSHVVLMSRFDADRALGLIEQHAVTWLYVVPTMMGRMLRLPAERRAEVDVSSLRTVFHIGAPCPQHVKRGWTDWVGPEKVVEVYAGTEALASTMIDGIEWLQRPGSVGKVAAGEITARDEEFREQPPGEVGELWLRPNPGTSPPYRYVGADPRARDGWESLGDMGCFDTDGYLYLADRSTDVILVGGANVYPAEVENALAEHPHVTSSAVIGLPDEDLGNVVHAILQTTRSVPDEELLDHLRARLAPYKIPRSFEFTSEPLRDDAGKVRRSELRAARLKKA
ncbi:AMP-binding protein [Saccharopolyspora sp. NPDC002376]